MTRMRRPIPSSARKRGHRPPLGIEALEDRQLLSATSSGLEVDAADAPLPPPPSATVVGRHIFYNDSGYDGNTLGASPLDFSAIAIDKSAYLPDTGMVTAANVTSYSKGINGVIVELSGTAGSITVADFTVRMSGQLLGTNNLPSTWSAAPTPTVTVYSDTPVSGTDRVHLVWAEGAITNRYLQVVVEGNDAAGGNNANTGLATSDIFYFGNKVGDDFTSYPGFFHTNATDEINTRNNQGVASLLPTNSFDFNRDFFVNSSDQIIARNNQGSIAALNILSPGSVFLVHDDGSRVSYPAAADTDEARGTAFRDAANAAVSGDTVQLGPGTYNIDATEAAIYLKVGVAIKGSGMGVTTIESALAGHHVPKAILVLNHFVTLEDFTFHGTAVNAYQRPIGSENLSINNAVLRRIGIYAPNASDAFYDWGLGTSSYYLYDCDFRAGSGAIKMLSSGGSDTLYAENCYFEVLAENYAGPEDYLAIVAFNKWSTQTFKNCQFVAHGDAYIRTAGALVWGEYAGVTILENCQFDVSSSAGLVYDLDSKFYEAPSGTPEFIVSGGQGSGAGGAYVVSDPNDVTYLDSESTTDDANHSAVASALTIPSPPEPPAQPSATSTVLSSIEPVSVPLPRSLGPVGQADDPRTDVLLSIVDAALELDVDMLGSLLDL